MKATILQFRSAGDFTFHELTVLHGQLLEAVHDSNDVRMVARIDEAIDYLERLRDRRRSA